MWLSVLPVAYFLSSGNKEEQRIANKGEQRECSILMGPPVKWGRKLRDCEKWMGWGFSVRV
jgi:hypothetical protein